MPWTLGDSASGGALIKVNASLVLRMHPLYLISGFLKQVKSALCPLNSDFLILRNCVQGLDHWVHSRAVPCGHLCEIYLTKGGVLFLQHNAAETIRPSSQRLLHLADLLGWLWLNEVAHLGDTRLGQLPQTGTEQSADNCEGAWEGKSGPPPFPAPPHLLLLWPVSGILFSKQRIPKRWKSIYKIYILFYSLPSPPFSFFFCYISLSVFYKTHLWWEFYSFKIARHVEVTKKKKKSSWHFPWNTGALTGCSNWWDFEFPFLVESENIY